LSAVYWGYTCLHLLDSPETLNADDVLKYVLECQNEDGGFGGHPGHDSHLLYTLSAVQLLVLLRALDRIDRDRIVQCKLFSEHQSSRLFKFLTILLRSCGVETAK
jgi:geranylgeranyl transferase type-2 subunit beta